MLDILFVTEVDSFDYDDSLKMLNYKAVIYNKPVKKKTRLIALIHEDIFNDIKVSTDLEIIDFPSVALEIEIKGSKKWSYLDSIEHGHRLSKAILKKFAM